MQCLPKNYQWLEAVCSLPSMVRHALALFGTAEAVGVADNRVILGWAEEVGVCDYPADSIPWCGLLAEGAMVGLAGGVVGVVLGHGLAWGALVVLGGDLGAGYFSGLTPVLQFQPQVTAVYVALGMLAGIAGAWLPAFGASGRPGASLTLPP